MVQTGSGKQRKIPPGMPSHIRRTNPGCAGSSVGLIDRLSTILVPPDILKDSETMRSFFRA